MLDLKNQIYYAWGAVRETNNAKVCFISANSDSSLVTLEFKDLTAETRYGTNPVILIDLVSTPLFSYELTISGSISSTS